MTINANRYGSDIGSAEINDFRFLDDDYSIGGGVAMRRGDIDHGFGASSEKGFRGKGPRNWERSDEKIKDEVCEFLYRSGAIDASDIDVDVKDGEVTLKGWVNDREEKKEAEICIENIPGVNDVFNELHLRNRKLQAGTSIAP